MTQPALLDARSARTQALTLPDFPRPDIARSLSPNGRDHWAVKRKARLHVINVVTVYAVKQSLIRMRPPVLLRICYVVPDHRARDQDNYSTGVTKAVIDCLVKGQWLDGDSTNMLRLAPVEIRVEKGRRALELTFETTSGVPSVEGTNNASVDAVKD